MLAGPGGLAGPSAYSPPPANGSTSPRHSPPWWSGYPGQHWLGQDPHRQTRPPIDALEGVAGPVLVAVGERDVPGFREMSAVLARRIPGATHHIVADAGHMINMEQPRRSMSC